MLDGVMKGKVRARSIISILWLYASLGVLVNAAELQQKFDDEVAPLFEYYCFDCHGDGMDQGGMNLDRFKSIQDFQAERELWVNIENHLKLQLMPPIDEEQMSVQERQTLLDWIDQAVFPVDVDNIDPGPSLIRRLNRGEYENTVNDLLGTRIALRGMLPEDDTGYGYDVISEVLTISPAHLEKYFAAGELALKTALNQKAGKPKKRRLRFEEQSGGVGITPNDHYLFYHNSQIEIDCQFRRAGQYELTIQAISKAFSDEMPPPLIRVDVGGRVLKHFFVTQSKMGEEYKTLRLPLEVTEKGTKTLAISLINREETSEKAHLRINEVELIEPAMNTQAYHYTFQKLFALNAKAEGEGLPEQYRLMIKPFLVRAFRRNPSADEVERYVKRALSLREAGLSDREVIQETYLSVLMSPQFLYREEALRAWPYGERHTTDYVDEFTLASRLSYFLWSSMPDAPLLELAQKGQLRGRLDQQVERMLNDEKSSAFIKNFMGQWLQLRDVSYIQPSRVHFPRYRVSMSAYMLKETELLLREIIDADKPLITILNSRETYLNGPLAAHYGVENVKGRSFRKVQLTDPERFGILGHGAFLALTSHPDRTSPVLRGKYVLENLLDISPPPPPQDANQITGGQAFQHHSLRKQLELHREDPSCASCHNLMDPIGFGLEGFDSLGRKRELYKDGQPILTDGVLYRGESFTSVQSMREALLEHYSKDFYRSAIKNMLTYATGRGLEWYDKASIQEIEKELEAKGGRVRALVEEVVHSAPFQKRRR